VKNSITVLDLLQTKQVVVVSTLCEELASSPIYTMWSEGVIVVEAAYAYPS
jgi:hypothetical protein